MAVSGVNKNPSERNAEATVHIGQLEDKVTDEILWELMQQASPVKHVYIPRDRITGKHFGYGFCEFHTPLDAAYANKVLNMVKLFGKPIRLSQSAVDRRSQDVGANLFIGNLSEDTDDKLLHDAFSTFGALIEPACIMRDANTGVSKSFGFVKYADFDAADKAISAMHGQYIGNRPIVVQYAFKKDGNTRERHGSQAERILAKRAKAAAANSPGNLLRQHTMFADGPPSQQKVQTGQTAQPHMRTGRQNGVQQSHHPMPPPSTHSWLQGHAPVQRAAYPAGAPPPIPHGAYSGQVGWAPRPAHAYQYQPQNHYQPQHHHQMYPPQPHVYPPAYPPAANYPQSYAGYPPPQNMGAPTPLGAPPAMPPPHPPGGQPQGGAPGVQIGNKTARPVADDAAPPLPRR